MSDTAMAVRIDALATLFDDPAAMFGAAAASVDPRRWRDLLLHQARTTPKLAECTHDSIIAAVSKLAQLGLEPVNGDAYLIPYGTECTLVIGYKGLVKLAMRSGEVVKVVGQLVHANDRFVAVHGNDERFEHEPDWFGDRGELIGAYALATMRDGSLRWEIMPLAEIDYIAGDKVNGKGPWSTDFREMARKCPTRRLCKHLPMGVDDMRVIQQIDSDERGSVIDATFVPSSASPAPRNAGALVDAPPAAADRYAQPAPATAKKAESAPTVDAKPTGAQLRAKVKQTQKPKVVAQAEEKSAEFAWAWKAAGKVAEIELEPAVRFLGGMAAALKGDSEFTASRSDNCRSAFRELAKALDANSVLPLAEWLASTALRHTGCELDSEANDAESVVQTTLLLVDTNGDVSAAATVKGLAA